MTGHIEEVVNLIQAHNALHAKKVRKNIAKSDDQFVVIANQLLQSYQNVLESEGKDFAYSVECYLQMIADMMYQQLRFIESGRYESSSFEEVNARVYADPSIMKYYMHGLMLSQVLWKHHYDMYRFFVDVLPPYLQEANRYLEVGGGHGLFVSKAIELSQGAADSYDLVDISATSLALAQRMIGDAQVAFHHSDIFDYAPAARYDFITMGEVLEHVEDPVALLKKLYSLLTDDGHLFITTPGNAPAIDHIYLFSNVDDVCEVIEAAGFDVVESRVFYAEDAPQEVLERMKIAFLWGGLLRKKPN